MTGGEFGSRVYENMRALQQEGQDANQIAKTLCDQDPQGHNYGIGIVLNGQGQPAQTSSTLIRYAIAEIEHSRSGRYMNSNAALPALKKALLQWQRIPEQYWEHFLLALPSDAGTGAVKTAIEIALQRDCHIDTLGLEDLGWPAYKALAKASRLHVQEFAAGEVIGGKGVLPLYQAGPMNTTGLVQPSERIQAHAAAAAAAGSFVILDRAYPGFEFARLLAESSYEDVMHMSYELKLAPFLREGVPCAIALGPTKAFVTFALRPCGLVLIFCPDRSQKPAIRTVVNTTIRARGSAFEHPVTRAFVKAMIHDRAALEAEHRVVLKRLAEAETIWRRSVSGTAIEYLYADNYAGLFRNPRVRENAEMIIYNEHLYPVFSGGRCRQNVTGIPDAPELAQKHIAVFAEQCY
ncbi:hypothetical protein CSB45_01895 [candidate division KSB3 bacterium]|uniref:Aminotransferase class I/classII large domain-containing protein n=1 Tax=candidate division KSB3 bacterium TaxID=2044937 RepID=A0A2G6E9N2_9BACT|nr:MAG: hypothetical protein CSB45_01895 [candidate division KSB3 bacterium]